MRRAASNLTLAVAVLMLPAMSATAAPDCRDAVETAFSKQRATKSYRFSAEIPSPVGATRMTIDYLQPDRMYQKVEAPGHPKPVETIAIGRWAWGTMGGGWEELQPQFAQSIIAHVRDTLVDPPKITASFTCLGEVSVDGQTYLGYRSSETAPAAPVDAKAPSLARTVYVDAKSGLPVRNIVERADAKEPPVFDGRYSYPGDIAIEAPVGGHDTTTRQ